MLNIFQEPAFDDSISKYEYHSYSPYLNNFGKNDIIHICVQHQNLNILPSESYIYVEGTVSKNDGSEVKKTQLVNNCIAFLFDEIRYELNGIEIDSNRNVGITTSIKNYISLNQNESVMLYNGGWCPNSSLNLDGPYFNFCLPLNKLLGFAEDFKKIIPNARHDLILTRSRTDENSLVGDAVEQAKITLLRIQWKVPHVHLTDSLKLKLFKSINENDTMKIAFRNWDLYEYPALPTSDHHIWNVKTTSQVEKPRYIIVALQTNKRNQFKENPTYFDHCDVINLKAYLNSDVYPYEDQNISFKNNNFSIIYQMYCEFRKNYYNCSVAEPLLTRSLFKSQAPIFVIDCRHQNEIVKTGPVDIRLEIKTAKELPPNTSAYCLMLHDRIINYNPLSQLVSRNI